MLFHSQPPETPAFEHVVDQSNDTNQVTSTLCRMEFRLIYIVVLRACFLPFLENILPTVLTVGGSMHFGSCNIHCRYLYCVGNNQLEWPVKRPFIFWLINTAYHYLLFQFFSNTFIQNLCIIRLVYVGETKSLFDPITYHYQFFQNFKWPYALPSVFDLDYTPITYVFFSVWN